MADYPALGFDPLPGDPMVVLALRDDAHAYGRRMTEEARRLRRLARPVGWRGEAAEAFRAELERLPGDLDRCGEAFLDLAGALERYHDRFVDAERRAVELDRQVAEARARLAAGTAADDGEELGALLREAHGFADAFDESVDDISRAIRRLTRFAPDEPFFHMLRRWASGVFGLSLARDSQDPVAAIGFFRRTPYHSATERARAVAAWARGLTDARWEELVADNPELVGSTAGIPYERRYQANRVLVERALAGTRSELEEARRRGDEGAVKRLRRRERSLEGLLQPGPGGQLRQFLLFDNRGDGRVAEVFGDLDDAANVAFMVPGMANDLDNYDRLAGNTRRLHSRANRLGRNGPTATIAWLGYDTPDSHDVLVDDKAAAGASALRDFNDGLLIREEAVTTVVAHSYGTLVTGTALREGLHVDNAALVGSPGIGVGNVSDLHLPDGTDVWAARAPLDPVTWSEWHGADPTDPRFGGRRFETGEASDEVFAVGHSSYFAESSESLRNLAYVVTDQDQRVTEHAPTFMDRGNEMVDDLQEQYGDRLGDGVAREVTDAVVDTGQEVTDKVGDIGEDLAEVAENKGKKAARWISDKLPG